MESDRERGLVQRDADASTGCGRPAVDRSAGRRSGGAADVDVVDVAAGADAEDRGEAVAEFAAQLGGELAGIVG